VDEPSYNFGNMAQKSLPNNRKLLDYEGKDRFGFFATRWSEYAQSDTFPYKEMGTYVLGFVINDEGVDIICRRLLE
jgi:hypothetical protein